MTDEQVERLAHLAMAYIKAHPDTPYDTGNLKLNALQVRKVAPYQYEIYIDLGIAPYQEYLNERDSLRGRPNRHHEWWEKMRVNVAKYLQTFIANGYDGDGIEDEIIKLNSIYEGGGTT